MQNCRTGVAPANKSMKCCQSTPISSHELARWLRRVRAPAAVLGDTLFPRQSLCNPTERLIMNRYSILLPVVIAAIICSSLLAQEKTALQAAATIHSGR
jgi:hypothetical protein